MPLSRAKKAAIGLGVTGVVGTAAILLIPRAGASGGDITITPASPPQGSTATVNVSGMGPSEMVDVSLDSAILATGTTDAAGAVSISVIIPANTTIGSHPLVAVGRTTARSKSIAINVIAGTQGTNATITMANGTVMRGQSINFDIANFGANEQVDFFLGLADMGDLTTNASGAASGTLAVPASTPVGTSAVTATGRTTLRTATATLQITESPVNNFFIDLDVRAYDVDNPTVPVLGVPITITGGPEGSRTDFTREGHLVSFRTTVGQSYVVTVASVSGWAFANWSPAAAQPLNPARPFNPLNTMSNPQSFTAFYRGTGQTGQSSLSVIARTPAGESLGMFTALMTPALAVVATGFTPTSFTLTNATDYILQVQDFLPYVFSHYILPNGQTSTNRNLPVNLSANTVIVAIFNVT